MIKNLVREFGRAVKFLALLIVTALAASLLPGDDVDGNVVGTVILIAAFGLVALAIRVPLRSDTDR